MNNKYIDKIISFIWVTIIGLVITILIIPDSKSIFIELTRQHPYLMGIIKFGLLGTMGELLSFKIITGKWKIKGIGLYQRALIWAIIGILLTLAFPLFSYGIGGIINQGLLPGKESQIFTAFWKSFFMQLIFAFPFMTFHRFTDTLIERNLLFSKWPVVEIYKSIDWKNMFNVVGVSIIVFWLPVHTFNFLLPPEFRVIVAALLAIVLGFILGMAKRLSLQKK